MRLEVSSSADSRLIDVSMTDSDPNSCKVIVQSIVDQYIKDQQEKNRDRQYSLNQDLEEQRTTEEDKIKLINGDISDLQADLNTAGVTGTMNKIEPAGRWNWRTCGDRWDQKPRRITGAADGAIQGLISADRSRSRPGRPPSRRRSTKIPGSCSCGKCRATSI
jgi:hypothetical protein